MVGSTRVLCAAAACMLALMQAQAAIAATVAYYSSASASSLAATVVGDVTASPLAPAIGLNALTGGTQFAVDGFGTASSAAAQAANDAISWSIQSAGGIDLTSVELGFRTEINGAQVIGPANVELLVSVNSGGYQSVYSTALANGNDFTANVDLTTFGFDPASIAEFLLVGWNAQNPNRDFFLVNTLDEGGTPVAVRISGEPVPQPVPLPAALPLLLVALGGLGVAAARRRRG